MFRTPVTGTKGNFMLPSRSEDLMIFLPDDLLLEFAVGDRQLTI
jgi:hypothetical protein